MSDTRTQTMKSKMTIIFFIKWRFWYVLLIPRRYEDFGIVNFHLLVDHNEWNLYFLEDLFGLEQNSIMVI